MKAKKVVSENEWLEARLKLLAKEKAFDKHRNELTRVRQEMPEVSGLPADWRSRWREAPLVLITGHRRENFRAGFESICHALRTLAQRHPELDIVYPVHLNPHVQEPVRRLLGQVENVRLIEPLACLLCSRVLEFRSGRRSRVHNFRRITEPI